VTLQLLQVSRTVADWQFPVKRKTLKRSDAFTVSSIGSGHFAPLFAAFAHFARLWISAKFVLQTWQTM
jgi:hypothetical protein